jgi:hypothetical protein
VSQNIVTSVHCNMLNLYLDLLKFWWPILLSLTTRTSQYVRREQFWTAKSTDCHCMCNLVDGADGGETTLTDGHLSSSGAGFVFQVLGLWTHCMWQIRFWYPTLDLNTAILQVLFAEWLFVLRYVTLRTCCWVFGIEKLRCVYVS